MADLLQRLKDALMGRYAVDRTLGAGGMATVFLATDLRQGDRRVAIKVLRPELAAALGAERFLHEIRLTANLQHPHILPLFDSGDADSLLYYVMPLVEGESLRERLARETQLPIAEAIRITTQIAHALEYAHSHGVIHRDVKPGNILLSRGEAILADFGIARAVTVAGGEKLTATGLTVGTPHYMSPEQAAGTDAIDGRSDIYSLACVLYEMLAGDPPFLGSSAQAIVARKFAEPAPSLRTVRETISEVLDRVVLKALARVPADRFRSAAEFAAALAEPDGVGSRPRRRLGRHALIVSGLSVATLAVAIPALRLVSDSRPELDPRRVVFTPFENRTGDTSLDNLGEITTDWLIRELQSTELLEVVDQRALVAGGRKTAAGGAEPLGRDIGAGTIVSLAYYRLGDSVRFQARLTEIATGARLYTSDPVSAPLRAPLEGMDDLGEDLVGAVVTLVAPGVEWRTGGSRPPSYAAYKEFMAGMARLPALDFEGAIQHWFRATRLDTAFVTPLLSAASFMLVSGQSARADSLVSIIFLRRDRLRASERQRLDNLRARVRGNIPEALAALRPLAATAPISEVAWELALHELWLNRPREAIEAFGELNPSWEFLRGWWFYWVFYSNAYHMLGDHDAELGLARRGRSDYPKSIRVTEPEIAALAALHREDDLQAVIEEISAMPPEEEGDLSRALMIAAEELRAHGQPAIGAELLRRARDAEQDPSPAEGSNSMVLVSALTAYLSGHWDEARELFSALAAQDSTDVNVRGHLGAIAARTGNRSEALRVFAWLEDLDRSYLYGYDTLWRARIAALLGQDDRAIDLLRAAFGEGLKFVGTFGTDHPARTFGPWLHRDFDFETLRKSSRFQQILKGSRR